ncbi:type 1 glutamine amidotransferase [candidate division KSB1 bacterium]|nr:type 1 glutamine amidotransferase [candidate division KSB1 bacterium]RQW01270.1 MAG: type 1 glutamine amidotransferase [candidate division KSB1 bacterium]
MRLHVLQHAPFENPGAILDWAYNAKIHAQSTHLYKNESLPALHDFDLLIVMGGPMSVHDDERIPWLRPEKKFIEQAIKAGVKVVGICLGAQLLADVLGARVYPHTFKEIGWFPIEWSAETLTQPLFDYMPRRLDVFHWHGDTFDLPRGALHLAKSGVCENQAFLYGDTVLALQFHLEVKQDNVIAMLDHCADDLVNMPYIQTREEILAGTRHCTTVNEKIFKLLDAFAQPASLNAA